MPAATASRVRVKIDVILILINILESQAGVNASSIYFPAILSFLAVVCLVNIAATVVRVAEGKFPLCLLDLPKTITNVRGKGAANSKAKPTGPRLIGVKFRARVNGTRLENIENLVVVQ